jgi:hypothetical protein
MVDREDVAMEATGKKGGITEILTDPNLQVPHQSDQTHRINSARIETSF